MAEFSDALDRVCNDESARERVFRSILVRLLNDGVIIAGDSEIETDLYDALTSLQDEVEDYFSVSGCRLVHNANMRCFRLYPPRPSSPEARRGQDRDNDPESMGTLLRRRPSPHVAACAVALRILYSQKVAANQIEANGEVAVKIEEINMTLTATLGRKLPTTKNDRKSMLRELDTLWRIARVPTDADLLDVNTMIRIRALITDLISEEVLQLAACKAEGLLPQESDAAGEETVGAEEE
ncbi:MAG: DUF4194 domain-containing protein [Methanocella sp.]